MVKVTPIIIRTSESAEKIIRSRGIVNHLDLRRALPDVHSTHINKGVSFLCEQGKVERVKGCPVRFKWREE